jgi:hypothetical protein
LLHSERACVIVGSPGRSHAGISSSVTLCPVLLPLPNRKKLDQEREQAREQLAATAAAACLEMVTTAEVEPREVVNEECPCLTTTVEKKHIKRRTTGSGAIRVAAHLQTTPVPHTWNANGATALYTIVLNVPAFVRAHIRSVAIARGNTSVSSKKGITTTTTDLRFVVTLKANWLKELRHHHVPPHAVSSAL